MEKIIDILFKGICWLVILIVALIECGIKLVSLILFIPLILGIAIVYPIFRVEESPKFIQDWGQYMSENYLRSVKFLKKYYFG